MDLLIIILRILVGLNPGQAMAFQLVEVYSPEQVEIGQRSRSVGHPVPNWTHVDGPPPGRLAWSNSRLLAERRPGVGTRRRWRGYG